MLVFPLLIHLHQHEMMSKKGQPMRFILGSVILLFICISWSDAHDFWASKYRDRYGIICCTEKDCRPVKARILAQTADTVTAEIDGITVHIPAQSVHTSETTEDWWCARGYGPAISEGNTRCLFIASGT